MASYTVQPGDSWAKIAGQVYGDQRRYQDLANANGGLYVIHPGDTINLPDFSNAPAPVITNQQFANAPTGVKNGQVQYGNQGASQQTQTAAAGVQLPSTTGVQLPAIGGAGLSGSGPHGTGSAGANPNAVGGRTQKPVKPKMAKPGFKTPQTSNYTPPGGALPYGQPGAGTPASGPGLNSALVSQPGARGTGRPGSPIGPMGGGAGPASGSGAASPNPFGGGDGVYRPFGAIVPDFLKWLMTPQGTYNPPPRDSMQPRLPTGFGLTTYQPSLPGSPAQQQPANPQQNAYAARYQGQVGAGQPGAASPAVPGTPPGFPPPTSEVDPSMAHVAEAARYSAMAIYAYGGGYNDRGLAGGNRNTLPTIIHALVAAQLPRPPGMSDADYMLALGYTPDENGNYVRQDPITSQGYGGGSYDTQTPTQPGTYGGYGGGYGGFGGYDNGIGRSGVSTPGYGLVNWRITG